MDGHARRISTPRVALGLLVVVVVGGGALALADGPVGRALDDAAQADRAARANASLAARSAVLGISPVDVRPSVAADGTTVLSVHLTARVYAAQAVKLRSGPPGNEPNPVFRLTAPRSIGVVGSYAVPVSDLAANRVTDFALTFDFRGLSEAPAVGREVASVGLGLPMPGIWLLEMDLVDTTGLSYRASTLVMVVAGA